MKIVILSDDFPPRSFGGGGIIAFLQARELAKRGHEVSVITTVQERGLEQKMSRDGLTIYQIYSHYPDTLRDYVSFYNPQTVSRVRKILKNIHPDVIHIHNIHIHLSYRVFALAKAQGSKVFFTAHDTISVHLGKLYPKVTVSSGGERIFDYKVSLGQLFRQYGVRMNPFRKSLAKRAFKKADAIFAVSHALAESLRQNGINNIEVMHNGIDTHDFLIDEQKTTNFKNKYRLQGKKVLFFGGRISIAKGSDTAIYLLAEVIKIIPDVCLLVAGKENHRVKDLLSKADSLGIGKNVCFVGWLDRAEVVHAYHASDIVLSLSLYMDPFPTVNLEAMAAKKPVIGTCFGGTSEAVSDNQTGLIVDPHDVGSVASAALNLLQNESLSKVFGQKGYDRLIKEFRLAKQVDELEKRYVSKA